MSYGYTKEKLVRVHCGKMVKVTTLWYQLLPKDTTLLCLFIFGKSMSLDRIFKKKKQKNQPGKITVGRLKFYVVTLSRICWRRLWDNGQCLSFHLIIPKWNWFGLSAEQLSGIQLCGGHLWKGHQKCFKDFENENQLGKRSGQT